MKPEQLADKWVTSYCECHNTPVCQDFTDMVTAFLAGYNERQAEIDQHMENVCNAGLKIQELRTQNEELEHFKKAVVELYNYDDVKDRAVLINRAEEAETRVKELENENGRLTILLGEYGIKQELK